MNIVKYMASAVLTVAATISLVAQYGQPLPIFFDIPPQAGTQPTPAQVGSLDAELLDNSKMAPPAEAQDLVQLVVSSTAPPAAEILQDQNSITKLDPPCKVELTATPVQAAMVALDLAATCPKAAIVNITQGPLKFSIMTAQTGLAHVVVPALSARPSFTATLDSGEKAKVDIEVPDFTDYNHTVLMWQGHSGIRIHAYEQGTEHINSDHINRDQPKGHASFLTSLGAPSILNGWSAEVLSTRADASGVVRLHIKAEVTARTCGHEIHAQTLQHAEKPVDLTISIPGCESIGDFLVLKNVLHDIKFAANN